MNTNEEAANILDQAAIEIGKGWTKGKLQTPKGRRVCADGAIRRAFSGNALSPVNWDLLETTAYGEAIWALKKMMSEYFGVDHTNVGFMNDHCAKDRSEIIHCMEMAAKTLRAQDD